MRASSSFESRTNDSFNCNTAIPATAPIVTKPPRKREVEHSDHIQFLITEKTPRQTRSTDDDDDVVVRECDEGDVVTEGMYVDNFCESDARTREKVMKISERTRNHDKKKFVIF